MTVKHSNLTGTDLHEPKGVASANSAEVYVADGAGSGDWSAYLATDLSMTGITSGDYLYNNSGTVAGVTLNNANLVYLNMEIQDISGANACYIVSPIAGTIDAIWSVIDGAVDADTDISFDIEGTGITDGDITITAAGSGAATKDSSTPSGNNTVSAGDYIRGLSDGAGTNSVTVRFTIRIDVS